MKIKQWGLRAIYNGAVCSAALMVAVSAQAVTLDEVLQDVVVTNPRVLEEQKAYNKAVAEQGSAFGAYLPTVVFTGNVGYKRYRNDEVEDDEIIYDEETGENITGYTVKNDGFYDARLTVSQLLYDFGKTPSLVEARRNYMLAALYSYLDEASQVSYETIVSYLDVLKFAELLQSAVENVLTHKKLRESVRKQVDAGKKGRSELERINGRLASAQSRLLKRRNDYQEAIYTMHKLLGRFVAAEDLVPPCMDSKGLPASLEEAIKLQRQFNPKLREAYYSVAQKKSEYQNKRRDIWGRLSMEGSARVENEFEYSDEYETDARIGLRYTHTLFDAGRSHRTAAAASDLHQERQKGLEVRRTLLNDIQLCWAAHKLLTEQIGLLKKNLYYTQSSLVSYKKEFMLGRRSLINILDAQNENQYVSEQLINAIYTREQEKYKVLHSEGRLLTTLGLLRPEIAAMINEDKNYTPLDADKLPLSEDLDNDGVADDVDVSMNSRPDDEVNGLGISTAYDSRYIQEKVAERVDITENRVGREDSLNEKPMQFNVVTRFDFDAFLPKSSGLTTTMTKKMMKELVRQARAYSRQTPLYLTVSTNEYDDANANYALALQRAYTLKRILQQNRIENQGVFVFADSNAPKGHNVLRMKFADKTIDYSQQYRIRSLAANIFAKGKGDIADREKLDLFVAEIARHPGKVEVILYSNELADSKKSEQLGLQRIEALKSYLEAKGVEPDKVFFFAWGGFQEDPILPDSWKVDQVFQYVLR